MTSPQKLLPAIGLGFLASSLVPDQPSTAEAPAKAEAPPTPAPPASQPSTAKPKRSQPSFLSGASLLPPPGTATQGKSLLGA